MRPSCSPYPLYIMAAALATGAKAGYTSVNIMLDIASRQGMPDAASLWTWFCDLLIIVGAYAAGRMHERIRCNNMLAEAKEAAELLSSVLDRLDKWVSEGDEEISE